MRITFIQSGGFVGAVRQCTLDTATMSADEARTVEALVQKADLSVSRETRSRSGRDLEEYQISVHTGDRSVTIVLDQSTLSTDAKALVAYLKKCAKPGLPRSPM